MVRGNDLDIELIAVPGPRMSRSWAHTSDPRIGARTGSCQHRQPNRGQGKSHHDPAPSDARASVWVLSRNPAEIGIKRGEAVAVLVD